MTETSARHQAKKPSRLTVATVVATAFAVIFAGCSSLPPSLGDEAPSDGPYLVEFDPEPARGATASEEELLRSPDRVNGAAVLSEDGSRFTVIRIDSPGDICSEAPVRLMVVDPQTILVTYRFLGEAGQICNSSATTRVDEFEVPPGIDPVGVEVRTASEAVLPVPLSFDVPPAAEAMEDTASTDAAFPSLTAFELLSSADATPEQSAALGSTAFDRAPVVISNPDGSFTVVRADSAEPCVREPAELLALSAAEVSVNYRFLGEPGQDCGLEQLDRADTFEVPVGAEGAVTVSLSFEYPKYRPIHIEQLAL